MLVWTAMLTLTVGCQVIMNPRGQVGWIFAAMLFVITAVIGTGVSRRLLNTKTRLEAQLAAIAYCRACGYDLAGLPTRTACPECGAMPIDR
jgi:hypothetical protein